MELDRLYRLIIEEEEKGNDDYAAELQKLYDFIFIRDYSEITYKDLVLGIKKEQDALNERWKNYPKLDILSEYSHYFE